MPAPKQYFLAPGIPFATIGIDVCAGHFGHEKQTYEKLTGL
jgi:hypothetical protein